MTESEIYLDQLQSLHKAMIAVGAVPEWYPLSGMEEQLLVYVTEQKQLLETRDTTIAALQDEVERLRLDRDRWKEMTNMRYWPQVNSLLDENAQLRAQLSAQQAKVPGYLLEVGTAHKSSKSSCISMGAGFHDLLDGEFRVFAMLSAAPAEGSDK